MGYFSGRMSRISEPETLAMARRSRELAGRGMKVINLTLGEPDFNTPSVIKDAGREAIEKNFSYYSPVNGFQDLREVVCAKLRNDNNLQYTPEQIVVSTGAKQSIANAILCLIDPGDEVLMLAPYWVSYYDIVKLAEGVPVVLTSSVSDNFKVSPSRIASAITAKTKMLIINSPSNPAGAVYLQDELRQIAEVLKSHHRIFTLSDEIYEYINFTGHHHSIAEHSFLKERVILVNGVSKSFAMTGWRLGYMASSAAVAKACAIMQGQFTSGASSISQRAAVIAIQKGRDEAQRMCNEFKQRRDVCIKLLEAIPGIQCPVPDGAFYFFPDVSSYFGKSDGKTNVLDSAGLSMYLLNEGLVSTVPGQAFGAPSCIRISFAASLENLSEGIKRIKIALKKLK